MEGEVPVFQTEKELVAWFGERFVHAAFGESEFDGTPRFDGTVLHLNAYN
jgi:hypothetical protein